MTSSLDTPWTTPPSITCDFGWWNADTNSIFGHLSYTVGGNPYPPAGVVDYVTNLNVPVGFGAFDPLALGLPQTVVPTGINITSMVWDLGNGVVTQGPSATTTYTVAAPDTTVTLTVTDSLGRVTATTHRLNLLNLTPPSATFGRVPAGSGRT